MMRSLYSAITGLRNHQTAMDVIGNNIANVNTSGYKRERASFATMLGQASQGASAPSLVTAGNPSTATIGGTNGITIGLGSVLGSVDKIMTQGSSSYTGKPTDMMIQGEGMFVVEIGPNTYFTRTGNFDLDENGMLVDTNTGAKVQGYLNGDYALADNTNDHFPSTTDYDMTTLSDIIIQQGETYQIGGTDYTLESYGIDSKGVVTGVFTDATGNSVSREMFKLALATFNNEGGLNYEGNNFYTQSNNSGDAEFGVAGSGDKGDIMTSYLEMSNVDLSQEFTDMIVTQRGFQANSRVITVSDTLLEELINLKRS
ncbi:MULTISPECIES: flagellar hook-basal body complex protein [unclassified Dehalobacter]|uniref:flagellar hook-basal body complex protein n=1 Tax=unclassified Dehalobacter TaxID=2635733 RepID=UPI0004765E7C|nr:MULTISPECIES: flagellar hook-basal body complex protein [unclassified Dehalobacter]RJE48743.1 flagellar basal body rod protein FlgG [Dehalobacter sp. MCB1]TCX51835.1 flagellar basal body rod protein FlgG [Dehalobacter sp. 14DCB1]TCX52895.1 flagellar basal body rod protein FlgG [Dehalobacter sp. 12DCB1]